MMPRIQFFLKETSPLGKMSFNQGHEDDQGVGASLLGRQDEEVGLV